MRNVRVAFAGLSPLCEEIFRAALTRRPDIELVSPWTRLASLGAGSTPGSCEMLVVELEERALPTSLRALLAAAPPLRIIGLSADARAATIFSLNEERTVLFECSAEQLCAVFDRDS